MSVYSQNGWSAGDYKLMASYTVPGSTARLTLRKGDASVVLLYVAEQFHKTVEKLNPAQCGGYNPRSIIGARTLSNHASGTAEDLNWGRHARGAKGTFTAGQKTAVRKILAVVNADARVVRWGEDYVSAPVDGMHFELVGTPVQVRQAADRIRALKAIRPAKPGTAKPGSRTLRKGSTGADVAFVQRWLGLDDTGVFDARTATKVGWYQLLRGIDADRIVGRQTWREMGVKATF